MDDDHNAERWGRMALPIAGVPITSASLDGCSSAPTIDGAWTASDVPADSLTQPDGSCSGLYDDGRQMLDIGGSESCRSGARQRDDRHPVAVRQPPPKQITYEVEFEGDRMRLQTSPSATIANLTAR